MPLFFFFLQWTAVAGQGGINDRAWHSCLQRTWSVSAKGWLADYSTDRYQVALRTTKQSQERTCNPFKNSIKRECSFLLETPCFHAANQLLHMFFKIAPFFLLSPPILFPSSSLSSSTSSTSTSTPPSNQTTFHTTLKTNKHYCSCGRRREKKNLLMMLFDLLLVVYSSLFMMMTIQSHWYKSKMKIKMKKLFDTNTLRSACFLATAISSALAGSLANCLRRPDSTYT